MKRAMKALSLMLLFVLYGSCAWGEEEVNFTLPQSLTVIKDAAFKNDTSIVGILSIPESVSSIGAEAFSGCTGLTGVPHIPAGIREIGERAFYGCAGLSGVLTLPTNVVVGEDAFAGCGDLTIRYSDEMPAEYFTYVKNNNTSVTITGYVGPAGQVNLSIPSRIEGLPVTEIFEDAFYKRNDLLGTLLIPDSVTSIGQSAFFDCGFTGDLVIPPSVSSIGRFAFSGCSFTGILVLPDSLTYIGVDAFSDCSGLTGDLVIPSSVSSIGSGAFYGCSGFTGTLAIPDSVTCIEDRAFYNCSGLTGDLVIPSSVSSIGNGAFYGCSGFTGDLVIPSSMSSISRYAFYGCSGFTGTLVIPDSVTCIEDRAFYNCSGLTGDLVIPSSVSSIGNGAFYGCSGFIGTLTISDGVRTIGHDGDYGVFENCRFTGALTIPESVISIGNSAFQNCSGFTGELVILPGVESIGDQAFYCCSGFTGDLAIPNTVTSIGSHAFSGCSGFTGNLMIPDSVTSIGYSAFSDCNGFTGDLVIPNTATSIGNYAFYDCSGFTGDLVISATSIGNYAFYDCSGFTGKLVIPNSVTSIGDYAFSNCSGFKDELVIPGSVIHIGSYAFSKCTGFSEIEIQNGVEEIGKYAFYRCAGISKPLILPESIKNMGGYVFVGCNNIPYIVAPDNLFIESNNYAWTTTYMGKRTSYEIILKTPSEYARLGLEGQTKFEYKIVDDHVEIMGYDGENGTYWFAIPEEIEGLPVTVIRENAFKGNTSLKGTLTIPSSVTSIGANAFSGCIGFFGDLTIPRSVTEIGDYAFYQCTGLNGSLTIQGEASVGRHAFDGCSKVIGPLSIDHITSLEEHAFRGCSALEDWPKIPSQITEIPAYAFYNCYSIGYLMLPSTITQIGEYAFANCSSLKGSISLPDDAVIAGTAFSGCGEDFEILTYTRKTEIELAAQDTLFSMMNSMIEPDDLFSIMKDDSTTWMNAVANAAIEIANLDAGALLSDYNKKQYLLANTLKYLQNDTLTFKYFDISGIPSSLKDIQSLANCTKETYLNGLLDWCDEETKVLLTTEDFKKLFSDYYDSEKDNSSFVLMYLRVNGLAGKEEDILADMDFLRDISFISDILSELGKFEKGYKKTLEVMNQIQLLLALDHEALLQTARIYHSSSDQVVRYVGDVLEWLADANKVQIITSVVSGELSEFGLNQFLDEVVKKAAKKAITKGLGSYASTLTLSVTLVNTITGVDEVPRLTNELSYSADATRNAYAVFNTDKGTYDRYRDDESFTNAFWSYVTYCETAAQSQDAFIGLYEYIDNSMSGDIFITDEMREIVAFSSAQATGLRAFAKDAKAVYKLWEDGDAVAFKAYCEEMREKNYTYSFQTAI